MLANIKKKFNHHETNHLIRKRIAFADRDQNNLYANGKALINFSSNDYLNLAVHAAVKEAFIAGVNRYGLGSGSSPMISGYFKPQQELEEKFAEFLNREQAILFNSGYHANLGVMQALLSRKSNVLADKLCHASILDGLQLSYCGHYRYRHVDMQHLEMLANKIPPFQMLITEHVFSMEGDIAPVDQLIKFAEKYQALLMVDDAHGIGAVGETGRGICETVASEKIDCLVTPLGKAFGSMGAFVSGKKDLMKTVLQFARTYTYSTALPPAIAVATLAALKIMQQENWRLKKLQALILHFIKHAKQRNIPLISTHLTPIKTIMIGDNEKVLDLQKKLQDNGFFVSAIRTPTVPIGTARIRLSINSEHHEHEIEKLLDLIYDYIQNKKI